MVLVMVMVIYGWMVSMVQCLLLPFGFGNWRCMLVVSVQGFGVPMQ